MQRRNAHGDGFDLGRFEIMHMDVEYLVLAGEGFLRDEALQFDLG